MPKTFAASSAIVAAMALLSACAGPTGSSPNPWDLEHAVVTFGFQSVSPNPVRITTGGGVRWVSTAAESRAFVIFPASIAASFQCKELRPYFTLIEGVYRSQPITVEASEDVQLPCTLAPGSYDYDIWVLGAGFGEEYDPDAPQKLLHAQIVVEPAAPPAP